MRGPVVVNRRRGPGLVGTMARTAVIAGTATATAKVVSGAMSGPGKQQAAVQQQMAAQQQMADLQAQQADLAAQQADFAAQQHAAAAGPVEPGFDEQLVQIQKLSVMKDQGLLTEEEFQAKKKQILGL